MSSLVSSSSATLRLPLGHVIVMLLSDKVGSKLYFNKLKEMLPQMERKYAQPRASRSLQTEQQIAWFLFEVFFLASTNGELDVFADFS